MKRMITLAFAFFGLALAFVSCKKETKEVKQEEVPQSVLSQIKALGFNPNGAQKTPEGYLVEGDILLSDADLTSQPTSPEMVIAQEEHYRTNNLVNTSSYPTIKVALNNSSTQHQAAFSAALDEA